MSVAQEFKQRLEDFLCNPEKYVASLSEKQKTEIASGFGQNAMKAFAKQFYEVRKENPKPSMSSLGKCVRQLAYRYHGFKGEPMPAKSKMTVFFGDIIEAAIYAISNAAGWEIHDIQRYITIDEIGGHTDGMPAEDTVFDVKSASSASFEIAKRNGGVDDGFGYLTQLSLYKEGLQVQKGFFVFVNKNTGEIEVFEAPHTPDLVDLAKAKYKMVLDSTPDRLPPRPYTTEIDPKSKKTRLCMQCKFCDYRYLCWNIQEVIKGYNNSEVYVIDENNPYGPTPGYEPVSSTS